ncbi:MAG: NAD-dependent deacylase [bacterium]|nr:NAD-dependent deacylase [bacterium]
MGIAGPERLAQLLREARGAAVAFTGAGASTGSGLPDFRSPGGLWQQVDPIKAASIHALRADPVGFHRFYRERLRGLGGARPNQVHRALAMLEKVGRLLGVITQNVDGLHQAAGSRRVVELHGSLARAVCMHCRREAPIGVLDREATTEDELPRCSICGGLMRPDVVLFGEAVPREPFTQAESMARESALMLVIGSSLAVYPAAALPGLAVASGSRLAILNREPTPLDGAATLVINAEAGPVLANTVAALGLSL